MFFVTLFTIYQAYLNYEVLNLFTVLVSKRAEVQRKTKPSFF